MGNMKKKIKTTKLKRVSNKEKGLIQLFEECKSTGNFVFDNELVKTICKKYSFGNPFDMSKIDNSEKIPNKIRTENYFLIHLGGGYHKFVKGVKTVFHEFEEINENNIVEWKYRKSVLNEADTSESNILSVVANQRIIHDFLYEDIVASPKIYFPRRTKMDMEYQLDKEKVIAHGLQMEIDLTMEYQKTVTVIEGKNNFPKDFAVYQLFSPNYYYNILKEEEGYEIDDVQCCYVLKKRLKDYTAIRLYLYEFENWRQFSSIKLVKNAQYNLVKR